MVNPVSVPKLVILGCAAVAKVPVILPVAVMAPTTSKATLGVAVPIPTKLFVESTFKEFVSTVRSPVTVRFSKLGSTPLPKLIVSPESPRSQGGT